MNASPSLFRVFDDFRETSTSSFAREPSGAAYSSVTACRERLACAFAYYSPAYLYDRRDQVI